MQCQFGHAVSQTAPPGRRRQRTKASSMRSAVIRAQSVRCNGLSVVHDRLSAGGVTHDEASIVSRRPSDGIVQAKPDIWEREFLLGLICAKGLNGC